MKVGQMRGVRQMWQMQRMQMRVRSHRIRVAKIVTAVELQLDSGAAAEDLQNREPVHLQSLT